MVASNARKERRKQQSSQSSDQHDVDHVPKKKFKSGRKDMRTIRKAGNRFNATDDAMSSGNLNANEESEHEEEEEEEDQVNSDIEVDQNVINSKKAYESLVTLLSYEHKETKEPKQKKNRSSQLKEEPVIQNEEEANQQDEEDEDEIAGFVEEDDDEDAESQEEDELVEAGGEIVQDDDEEDQEDPFNAHFNAEIEIADTIKAIKESSTKKLKLVNKLQTEDGYSVLEHVPSSSSSSSSSSTKALSISSADPHFKVNQYNLKKKFEQNWQDQAITTPLERTICNSMLRYQNVNVQYYEDEKLESKYQDWYILHCLNHVFKTRDKILKNNYKKQNIMEQIRKGELKPEDEPEFRDQGYTRPKVLIMLPTRHFAYEVITKMIELANMETIENKSKFKGQFYDEFEFDAGSKKSKNFKKFFKGNTNDFFCLGIKFTRKSMKLYSSFDSSDIMIASPIGLKMILDKKPAKGKNNDFLSSIEVLVLDKSHGLLMQNWDHVLSILKKMNTIPKNFNDQMDFSRIRMWSLDDNSRYLTQFINFTRVTTPELNNVINSKSLNVQGTLTVKPLISTQASMINQVNKQLTLQGVLNNSTRLRTVMQRFEPRTPMEEPDSRFKYFINVTLSQLLNKSSYKNGFLIYVPSYMDYLRLTNYLKNNTKFEVLNIDEYSSQSKLTRSRMLFERDSNKYKIMLYTERLHFYKNYEIKGVKNLIFYGLPTDPGHYQDCINFIIKTKLKTDMILNGVLQPQDTDQETEAFDLNLSMIRILYSKFDFIKLEKLVGLEKATLLCNSANEMFEFR